MLQECLVSDYQRKFTLENFRKARNFKVAKRNVAKIPLTDFSIPWGRLEHRGVASSEKEQLSKKS